MSSLVDEYFTALQKGDFETFAKFCKIKRLKGQTPMLFTKNNWYAEQKKFFKDSLAGRLESKQPKKDIVVKARRIGMTAFGCLQDYFFALRNPGCDVMFVAQNDETRTEGLDMIRYTHEHLRQWGDQLGFELVPELDRDNVRTLKFANGSRIHSQVAKNNRAAANRAGRGKTISRLHCTEVAHWGFPEETMVALLIASSEAEEILIESSPYGSSGWFYRTVDRSNPYKQLRKDRQRNTEYRLHFFPWYGHEDYRLSSLPWDHEEEPQNQWERNLVNNIGIDQHQLAWWRREVTTHKIEKALSEYPIDLVSCFRASGGTFLDQDALAWLAGNHCDPQSVESLYGVPVAVWEPVQGSSSYIVGVDMGYGRGQDNSAFYVISCDGGRIVASGVSNEIDTSSFARVVASIGRRYNTALIAVEHQAAGHGCISDLITKEQYPNLFKHKNKDYVGFNTTVTSRVEMFYHIQSYVADRVAIPDANLINELENIILHKKENNRAPKPAASQGNNDDRVMAFGIALTVWMSVPTMTSTGYISVKKTQTSQIYPHMPRGLGKRGTGFL